MENKTFLAKIRFNDGVVCDRCFKIEDIVYDENFLVFITDGCDSCNAYWKPALKDVCFTTVGDGC